MKQGQQPGTGRKRWWGWLIAIALIVGIGVTAGVVRLVDSGSADSAKLVKTSESAKPKSSKSSAAKPRKASQSAEGTTKEIIQAVFAEIGTGTFTITEEGDETDEEYGRVGSRYEGVYTEKVASLGETITTRTILTRVDKESAADFRESTENYVNVTLGDDTPWAKLPAFKRLLKQAQAGFTASGAQGDYTFNPALDGFESPFNFDTDDRAKKLAAANRKAGKSEWGGYLAFSVTDYFGPLVEEDVETSPDAWGNPVAKSVSGSQIHLYLVGKDDAKTAAQKHAHTAFAAAGKRAFAVGTKVSMPDARYWVAAEYRGGRAVFPAYWFIVRDGKVIQFQAIHKVVHEGGPY